jgi:large subunit ribosomal protein L2
MGLVSNGGRNYTGKICIHHRGRLQIRKYKFIDFFRRLNSVGVVIRIEKDLNRSAFLGLISYENGFLSYIVLSENIIVGKKIYSGLFNYFGSKLNLGSSCIVGLMPLFSIVNNLEKIPYNGSIYVRAAGNSALLINKTKNFVQLKFRSG